MKTATLKNRDVKMTHTKDAVFAKSQDAVYRILEGRAVIVSLHTRRSEKEKITVLNETATRIWELINGKRSVAEIMCQIVGEFDIDVQRADSKVHTLIAQLRTNKLIDLCC